MTTDRSDGLLNAAREAQQKFDYFMLGVIGAVCAYIGQNFTAVRIGLNSGTVELVALLLLVLSATFGFLRIQATTKLMRVNSLHLRMQEDRGALMAHKGSPVINKATGEIYDAETIGAKIEVITEFLPTSEKSMKRLGKRASNYYSARNWLLLVGFLTLIAAKLVAAYSTA